MFCFYRHTPSDALTPFAIDAMPRRTRLRTPVRTAPSTDSEARLPCSRARTQSTPRRYIRPSSQAMSNYSHALAVPSQSQ